MNDEGGSDGGDWWEVMMTVGRDDSDMVMVMIDGKSDDANDGDGYGDDADGGDDGDNNGDETDGEDGVVVSDGN